ncbi:gamma-glutamyltranspeptidase [Citricoccus zhacaiensis]|uniref:Gamma-glutamyltranspeptidase n=1 Tax=Citricoccus zhacaiensis TaxID=489142 RepID=A0ABQ2LUA3_9MICC|nr:gamma-glutamyltransferase [Citricoccus zhacaiensis]GGO43228.1 gamma-glutamyltranspeptidase [Citricoccus zhacaiensis]
MQRTRTTVPALASMAALSAALLALTGCASPAPEDPSDPASGAPSSSASGSASISAPGTTPAPSASAAALQEQAVAAGHPAAVEVGTEILERGGNAADAAIATAFAVAVVEPFASGIGGGGSALVARGDGDPLAYDYRETVAQDGDIPASGTGIPGFVDGMATLHAEHGSLEWSELLAPAIDLAEEGSPVSPLLAQRMRSDYGPGAIEGLAPFHSGAGAGGATPLEEGETLVQAELAATMETLSSEGPDALYTGSLVEELTAVDGLDAESLAAYETVTTEPVSGPVGDYEYVSAAPPLPGAAVVQFLQVAEALGVAEAEPGSAEYVDAMAAAWQVSDASVTESFGDPAFVDVPVDRLTDPEANAELARTEVAPALSAAAVTDQSAATAAETGGTGGDAATEPAEPAEAGNTTHLTVVDDEGLTVSMTNTITSFWGGAEASTVGGFFLNNQLSRFESLDTPANQPEPGRKSVSWSAPSLVLDSEGRVVMGLGSPGGQVIPSILATVMVPWALQDVPLQEAVDSPRHYLQDGVLSLEEQPDQDVAALIRQRGWQPRVTERADAVFGSVQALEIDYEAGTITGAQDSRREGDVAVVPAD